MAGTGDQTSLNAAQEAADRHATAGHLALESMHEIRNPLETLGHLCYLTEQVRTYMRLADEQLRTLSRITSQTLSFARPSHDRKPVDLVALVDSALRIHNRSLNAKRIHLVRKHPETLVTPIQSARMLQVLSNLIANAVDSMPERGKLTLRIRARHRHVELLVADNGHGISSESMDKLFQPFFTTKQDGGNGLGLSLSKRIIEDHGGTLSVRSSTRPNQTGSVFRIRLPRESGSHTRQVA